MCTIAPLSQLHSIDEAATVDGYTQTGAQPNTATFGTNAVLKSSFRRQHSGAAGILLGAPGITARGLVINGGFHDAVDILVDGDVHVEGCFIGTDAAGLAASSNYNGVTFFLNGDGSVIGGPELAQRNLIGSSVNGVSGTPEPVTIQNNLVGTDATGAAALPQPANGSKIGFACTGATQILGNVITGGGYGINGQCSVPIVIQGNRIGIDASGTVVFPPGLLIGIQPGIGAIVGGINPGEGNVITGMKGIGITGDHFAGGTIRGNSIYGNGGDPNYSGLGIDMLSDGPTKNDPGDTDDFQNFPLLKSVTTGATTHIVAVLHSLAATGYDVDFYSNPACSNFPREYDEGKTFLGSTHVTTDGSGTALIDATLAAATEDGARITMIATNSATGRSSEFSQRLPFACCRPRGRPGSGSR